MPGLTITPELTNYFNTHKVMITLEKNQIKESLARYCARYGSQKKASESLSKVSSATVSQILNGNWELITDEMWRWVGSQTGWNPRAWNVVETRAFVRITSLLENAKLFSNVLALSGDAGSGKSMAMRHYTQGTPNTFHIVCNEYWNRKNFLGELLHEMGRNPQGYTVGEMMSELIRVLKKLDSPLILIDEADKLSDHVLYFFITLYNQLEDHCGIVLSATDHFEKRILRGLRLNKKGYKEIYSRLGSKFIPIMTANASDIMGICMANGVADKAAIKEVVKEAEEYGYDLRRVKRKIHAIKQK